MNPEMQVVVEVIKAFAQYGFPGLLSLALLYLNWKKDNDARDDAKSYTALSLTLQSEVHKTMEQMRDVVDKLVDHDRKGRR